MSRSDPELWEAFHFQFSLFEILASGVDVANYLNGAFNSLYLRFVNSLNVGVELVFNFQFSLFEILMELSSSTASTT